MWATAVAGWALLMPAEMGTWEDATRRATTGVAGIWVGMPRDQVERFLEDDEPWGLGDQKPHCGPAFNVACSGSYLFLNSRVVSYDRWGKAVWAGPYQPEKQRWPCAPQERVIPLLLAEKRAKALQGRL